MQPVSAPEPLASIISLLHPRAVLSKVVSGGGHWSIRKPRYANPAFCLMLEGSCFLAPDGLEVMELVAGDFVLFPEMPGFTLASDLSITPKPLGFTHAPETHGGGSGHETMRMLGGYCRFDSPNAQLLVRLLPPVIHIRQGEAEASGLYAVVQLIGAEASATHPGRDLVLERLVEVLLIEALRFRLHSAQRPNQGLLAGLADPGVARALREIHVDLGRRWTVAELARIAYMSRAVFAERFARIVGMPPMQYLLEWRMAVAKDLLRREHPPLAALADRVGYQSASAFSTAFTRFTGCSPSDFARQWDITGDR